MSQITYRSIWKKERPLNSRLLYWRLYADTLYRRLQQQQDVEKYEKIWASYLQKYEQIPLAKELSKIKETAMKTEASGNFRLLCWSYCGKRCNDEMWIFLYLWTRSMPFLPLWNLVREVSEQITKIQSQIIELEVEKTHMQGRIYLLYFFS